MPSLGAEMDAGRLLTWYVQPGQQVRRGDVIAMVETDKANIDVEVFEDGVVEQLLVTPGTKVPVGEPLALIGTSAAAAPAGSPDEAAVEPAAEPVAEPDVEVPAASASTAPAPAAPPPAAAAPAAPPHSRVVSPLVRRDAARCGLDPARVPGTGPGGIVTRHDVEVAAQALLASRGPRSSPYARCLALARGLDLGQISGTGPDGAVVARDLVAEPAEPAVAAQPAVAAEPAVAAGPAERAVAAEPTSAPPTAEDRAAAMRLAIARAMERANREIPHYHLGETVDVESALQWLATHNAELPPARRILPAVLVLKATALALRDYDDLNGYWIDDAFEPGPGIHLGVAINLRRGGLLAPAIRDADGLGLDELMAELRDLVKRTRAGGLTGSQLTDATITVSNLGDTGVATIHGVITPPQVALVGAGRITPRPWVVDDTVAVRRTIALSLAGDHRASDGHRGARFLATIAANLDRPETL